MNKFSALLCLILLLFFGCNIIRKEKRQILREYKFFYQKKIEFQDSLFLIKNDTTYKLCDSGLNDAKPRIITIISGSCELCIEKMVQWIDFRNQLIESFGYDMVYFILEDFNFNYFKKVYYPLIPNELQLIVDEKGILSKNNGLNDLIISKTLLINSNNEIKLIGSPIESDEMANLFLKEIKHE